MNRNRDLASGNKDVEIGQKSFEGNMKKSSKSESIYNKLQQYLGQH